LVVRVEVLYAPTCANSLMHLERVREAVADFGDDIIIDEIDVSEHPEALKKYPSSEWQEFKDGYMHYFTVVAVNGKAQDKWYWDYGKIAEAVKREIELKKGRK